MEQRTTPVASTEPLPVEATEPAPWVTVSRRREAPATQQPVSPRRVVTQVVGGLAVVLLVVGLLGSWAAQRLAEREAVTDAATIADVLAEAVITPSLTDALADGDAAAVTAMDAVVRERVLGPRVIRVKLWSPEGKVLYADEPQLVGRTFPLSDDQRVALSQPQTKAEVSALDSTENEFETGGRALEVYRPVWTPSGRELLFETYSPYDSVSQRSGQLWRGFAGVTVSSLLLLVVLTAPILWRLLRRLGEARRQRERLLERTLEASEAERRRIAATLHDGPVQDLVASAFVAAGSAARAEASGQPRMADDLRGLAASVRGNIRTLRTLLVDIYPPSLASAGLATALVDLAQSAAARGLTVQVDVEGADDLGLTEDQERLVHRVAQECLRNAAKHAAPCTATIRLAREGGSVVLDVLDDGPGFDPAGLDTPAEGHFGLRVLADLASDAGAVLQVASRPGAGTHWRMAIQPEGDGAEVGS
ncbi:Histidine kinase-, DNA gyrase B-, and HSP90-like ATPase [Pedococcus dokdonensis]|uniref:Histidine kinase-, DNA gyrase B-, and HSP90-like ATPase n=1 Tax=Pedococcus dokdonensis TaxID=443156 RepID=A0A1H0UR55_9MICO|nr:Histidine kinase-, DNA gyrase B-, and HSP90-like ATPase [Pedococcus dokdonensis]